MKVETKVEEGAAPLSKHKAMPNETLCWGLVRVWKGRVRLIAWGTMHWEWAATSEWKTRQKDAAENSQQERGIKKPCQADGCRIPGQCEWCPYHLLGRGAIYGLGLAQGKQPIGR